MKKKNLIVGIVVVVLLGMILVGTLLWSKYMSQNGQEVLGDNNSEVTEESVGATEIETEVETEIATETEVVIEKQKLRLMMIGDNLMHLSVVNAGVQADGSRNYDLLFEPIKEYLALADVKITNQETVLGGNHLGFSGYPLFNSPTELGDSIANVGFNVVLHATNHSADKGWEGMLNCINFWETHPEVLMLGMFEETDVENQDIGILEIDGVTFAILNYTYSPNMSTLPSWLQGHLGMLCNWDTATGSIDFTTLHPDVLTDIATAKQMADVVVVCPHWGTEYTFVPSAYQKQFAKQMTEAGADLIIGTHPHVIQPVEWVEGDNGNRALCYYSLGNYVSSQYDPKNMLEAMAWVTFETDGMEVRIVEEETGAIPMVYQFVTVYNHYENVYFLDDYTESLAQAHGIHTHGGSEHTLENLERWANEVLGDWRLGAREVFLDENNLSK